MPNGPQRARLTPEVFGLTALSFLTHFWKVPVAVYCTAYAIHFSLLTHTGTGNTFMSARFQSQLVGSLNYDPSVNMSYWAKMGDVHHAIRYGNGGLENSSHPAASPWYTWPTMKHPLGLWEDLATPAVTRTIGVPAGWNGTHDGFWSFPSRRSAVATSEQSVCCWSDFCTSCPSRTDGR